MMLDDNIVDHNEERYIPIRARGNAIIGYLTLSRVRHLFSFLLSDDFDAKLKEFSCLLCNYMNMTDKEIYSKFKKLYDPLTRLISVDLPAKASCRPPEMIKKDIKHEKNPMRLKQLNQELNKSYKIYRTRRK